MAGNPQKNIHRKSDAARRANQVIRGRTLLLMGVLGIVTFSLLFWRLWDLQINRHEEMQDRAVSQQTLKTTVTAARGTIYDKNHNVMAISATAETVILNPLLLSQFVSSQKTAQEVAKTIQNRAQLYVDENR